MDRRELALRAGDELRHLREERGLTQQEVEQRTAERFGYEQRVFAQQVSRIEKGALEKPPIIDLLRYGQVLGLSPDDIAEMYGLWPRQRDVTFGRQKHLDPRLQAAIDLAETLPSEARERFLSWIEFATLQARAERRAARKLGHPEAASAPAATEDTTADTKADTNTSAETSRPARTRARKPRHAPALV